ncbi:hypothetical protein OEW28_08720 [Defluviimonas sp. WL0002]|uniref:Uncharacterized protein n=1 Tax=Albidovulum marisflavi TaxID=2984159 RepID=A0ABT2ZC45_9RHOB|nr:hypothetical protein [Defluviimonas sp. WL0002]MCV2868710.1 hypothetical protein [Defluviimonas sp. WL0002]
MKAGDLPIVFLSLDEPWADSYFADLRRNFPKALRVQGVLGLDACHKAAAKAAGTRWFVTVDCDTLVQPEFAEVEIPEEFLTDTCRIEWSSRNGVNGLSYGNGSVKCWPARLVERMRTHEAAPSGQRSIDHDIGKARAQGATGQRILLPGMYSTTHPAQTPFHAFRCGFREGARLASGGDVLRVGKGFSERLPSWHRQRVTVWGSLGRHAPNGIWVLYGARLGVLMAQLGDWDVTLINDYRWFGALWEDMVAPRFAGVSAVCPMTGFRWDVGRVEDEARGLARRLQEELAFTVPEVEADASRFIVGHIYENRSPSMMDIVGVLFDKGRDLKRDPARAEEHFEIGVAYNLASSHNNLARMHHLERSAVPDTAKALYHYERAVELEDRFAPWHLANFLSEREPGRDPSQIAMLKDLSRARGFDPDAAGQQPA